MFGATLAPLEHHFGHILMIPFQNDKLRLYPGKYLNNSQAGYRKKLES